MMNKLLKYCIAWLRIPRGMWCSSCIYWRGNIAPIRSGDGFIAYCKYLDKTDIDIIKETKKHITDINGHNIEFSEEEALVGGFCSLLWDGVKECGIKE